MRKLAVSSSLIYWLCFSAPMALAGAPEKGIAAYQEGIAAYRREDYATALRLLFPLADQGNAGAQYNLGLMYYGGHGVPQNDAQAVAWWRKAADQGFAMAQFSLGTKYAEGEGLPQNDAQAVVLYRKAAEQGHAEAQFYLGNMYANGWGVPQDKTQAAAWFRKAADQGHAAAQLNLGVMYANGEGVPQDYAWAHLWLNLAAAAPADGDAQKRAAKARDLVAAIMTPQQIAEAQRLAREWKPKQGGISSSLSGHLP